MSTGVESEFSALRNGCSPDNAPASGLLMCKANEFLFDYGGDIRNAVQEVEGNGAYDITDRASKTDHLSSHNAKKVSPRLTLKFHHIKTKDEYGDDSIASMPARSLSSGDKTECWRYSVSLGHDSSGRGPVTASGGICRSEDGKSLDSSRRKLGWPSGDDVTEGQDLKFMKGNTNVCSVPNVRIENGSRDLKNVGTDNRPPHISQRKNHYGSLVIKPVSLATEVIAPFSLKSAAMDRDENPLPTLSLVTPPRCRGGDIHARLREMIEHTHDMSVTDDDRTCPACNGDVLCSMTPRSMEWQSGGDLKVDSCNDCLPVLSPVVNHRQRSVAHGAGDAATNEDADSLDCLQLQDQPSKPVLKPSTEVQLLEDCLSTKLPESGVSRLFSSFAKSTQKVDGISDGQIEPILQSIERTLLRGSSSGSDEKHRSLTKVEHFDKKLVSPDECQLSVQENAISACVSSSLKVPPLKIIIPTNGGTLKENQDPHFQFSTQPTQHPYVWNYGENKVSGEATKCGVENEKSDDTPSMESLSRQATNSDRIADDDPRRPPASQSPACPTSSIEAVSSSLKSEDAKDESRDGTEKRVTRSAVRQHQRPKSDKRDELQKSSQQDGRSGMSVKVLCCVNCFFVLCCANCFSVSKDCL